MLSRHSQIRQQVNEIAQQLSRPGHIQKIFSTSRYLCFQVRLPGKSIVIYLGRGGGCEGIWSGTEIPNSFLRKRDRWLEWCRKNFTSSLLLSVDCDAQDRIVRLEVQKGGERSFLYVAWIGRDCYFALEDATSGSWFTSWNSQTQGAQGFEKFDEVGRVAFYDPVTSSVRVDVKELLASELALAERAARPKKKLKSLETKIEKIKIDIRKIKCADQLQEYLEATDPVSYESVPSLAVAELRYKFPAGLSTGWKRRGWLFAQVKRLREAEILQESRLTAAEAELRGLLAGSEKFENTLRVVSPHWNMREPLTTVVKKPPESDYVIHQMAGFKVGVGLSARGNDQLRSAWAKSEDWWVHASQQTSSHAIIKVENSGSVSTEAIVAAARLIAKQSGIAAAIVDVIFTQVKNVRGVTGSPGMVTYKKAKTMLCDLSSGE